MHIFDRIRLHVKNAVLLRGDVPITMDEEVFSEILSLLSKKPRYSLSDYVEELSNNDLLERQFEIAKTKYNLKKYRNFQEKIQHSIGNVCLYYALLRELRPSVVVETGTATGSMTSYLLAALNKNGAGDLYSGDLPPVSGALTMNITVDRSEIGYFIPNAFKDRWNYIEGDSRTELLPLMSRIGNNVGFFVHDSLHTSNHMLLEYAIARTFMPPDTIIMSDDIRWNKSFFHFCNANALPVWSPRSNPNLGVCLNRWSAEELAASQSNR